MEVTKINEFFDIVVVNDRNETFEGLDVESNCGLIVLFDSAKMSASKAEQLSEKLWKKLVDAGSSRLNALDFASTYAGKDKPCVPVSIAKRHLIEQYQELAIKTMMELSKQVQDAPDEAFNPQG